jgi:hypothetical protein
MIAAIVNEMAPNLVGRGPSLETLQGGQRAVPQSRLLIGDPHRSYLE